MSKANRYAMGLPARTRKKKEVDEDVLTLARKRMDVIFERHDHVAVSFSGGKDSTVCFNLALEAAQRHNRLPLDVVFFDEEAISRETTDYMKRVYDLPGISLRWLCVPIHSNNACSPKQPFWYPWEPTEKHLWVRPLPDEEYGIPYAKGLGPEYPGLVHPTLGPGFNHHQHSECGAFLFPDKTKRVAFILGLRSQESLRRHRAVSQRVHDNYLSHSSYAPWVTVAKPIYDWKTEDVWTAPAKLGWDYNTSYDTMRAAGIPPHSQRVCPPYHQEAIAALWIYPVCWPDLWEKMINRVPGARTAMEYAGGPAYGHSAAIEPSEGESWEELIARYLERWPPDVAAQIADRLQREIGVHFQKTRDPIPIRTPHKDSGVSWTYLVHLAIKGDLKGRSTAVQRVVRNPEVRKQMREDQLARGK